MGCSTPKSTLGEEAEHGREDGRGEGCGTDKSAAVSGMGEYENVVEAAAAGAVRGVQLAASALPASRFGLGLRASGFGFRVSGSPSWCCM